MEPVAETCQLLQRKLEPRWGVWLYGTNVLDKPDFQLGGRSE
jgi:hypothetical protein